MNILLLLAVIAGLIGFWIEATPAREQMLRSCRRVCEEMNVQLLDQTVALARLRLDRGLDGRLLLRRRYAFEFSISGADRWRGTAELRGRHIESIHMEHPDGPVIFGGGNPADARWG